MPTVHLGDCREVLATIADNSIDSIVTDPPYELGFMGKAWDKSGIAYDVTVWQQCLRVLKPGGHLVAFGGSRTYHRMAVAIEDAGFEIRDQIQWIYGSGFPKSLDVSKAMDKQAGAEHLREDAGPNPAYRPSAYVWNQGGGETPMRPERKTAPATDLAKQWQGWGTALKPAHEPAVLARKPLCGTVADNVTTWGVGAINVDATRVGYEGKAPTGSGNGSKKSLFSQVQNSHGNGGNETSAAGRWPANVILDEEAAQVLDAQSGERSYHGGIFKTRDFKGWNKVGELREKFVLNHPGTGGASRFFYVAKASKAEREAGLYYEEWQNAQSTGWSGDSMPLRQDGSERKLVIRANHHPTVKPIALMRYLVRMVTPKGGVVLDPFTGSGSTGCAAVIEGCDFVGMDITPEYVEIAQKRIAYYAVESPLLL